MKKCPNLMSSASNVDIRALFELEDFAKWVETGEFAAGVKARHAQIAAKS
jgi:hypothetical protein